MPPRDLIPLRMPATAGRRVSDDPRADADPSRDAASPPPTSRRRGAPRPAPSMPRARAALGGAAERAGLDLAEGDSRPGTSCWRAMGGMRGILESVLPGLVFLVVYTLTSTPRRDRRPVAALGLSVGLAVVFTLVARSSTQSAVDAGHRRA